MRRTVQRLLMTTSFAGVLAAVALAAAAPAMAGCPASLQDPYGNAVRASSPVVFYRLAESAGPTMCDSSGHGSNATYSAPGALTFGAPGPLSGSPATALTANLAAVYNGRTGGIGVGPFPAEDTGEHSFTLEGWFRGTGVEQSQILLALASFEDIGPSALAGLGVWHDRVGSGPGVCVGAGSVLALDTFASSVCWVTTAHGINLYDGKWHYLAIAYNAAATTATGYVDGEELGTQSSSRLDLAGGRSAQVLAGDWVDEVVNQPFQGGAANLAVYPAALSAAQISAHYAAAGATSAEPSIKIEKFKVTSRTLDVKVKTSAGGTVTITDSALRKTVVKLASGIHTVKVPLSKSGRRDVGRHTRIKVSVSLTVGTATVSTSEKVKL